MTNRWTGDEVRWGVGAALALLLAHAVVAVWIDLSAYADGAWFDFALAVGKPFQLVWRNYPTRMTPYLFEFLPAYGLLRAHVPVRAALAAGHAVWHLAPVVSLAFCYRALPRPERAVALLPAAYFVLFGLLTWGFPTEVWLVAVFAWPAVILLAYGPNTTANAVAAGLLMLAAFFSHEAALVLTPLFVAAGAVRLRDRPPHNAIGAVLAVVASLGLWAWAKATFPVDPVVSRSVGHNAEVFFGPGALVGHPALGKYALIALCAGGALIIAKAWPRGAAAALVGLALLGLVIALQDAGLAGTARYQVRSICILALGASIALAIARRLWPARAEALVGVVPMRTAALAVALMALAVVEQDVRFALAWSDYERVLSAAVNCAPGTCAPGGVTGLPPAVLHSPAAWTWGAPFQAVVLAKDPQTSNMIHDDPAAGVPPRSGYRARLLSVLCKARGKTGCDQRAPPALAPVWFMPLNCSDARVLTLDGRRPRAMASLAAVVCEPH